MAENLETADAMALPYDDNSFDVVIIANALHIVPDPEKVLSEIDRNGIIDSKCGCCHHKASKKKYNMQFN